MLLSPRKNGLISLFKEVRVFKEGVVREHSVLRRVLKRLWGRVLGECSQKGSEKGALLWGSQKGF